MNEIEKALTQQAEAIEHLNKLRKLIRKLFTQELIDDSPSSLTFNLSISGLVDISIFATDIKEVTKLITYLRKYNIKYRNKDNHKPIRMWGSFFYWRLSYKEDDITLFIDINVHFKNSVCEWVETDEKRTITQKKRQLICSGNVVDEVFE